MKRRLMPRRVTRAVATGAGALALLSLGIGALAGFACSRAAKQERPLAKPTHNVLVITLDTTRVDRLGCYGHTVNTSPSLDRLARDGILFDNAIAQAGVTNISHASIFTGLYPYHHGVRFLLDRRLAVLSGETTTMAGVFRESGARTAAFVSAATASSDFGLDLGFETFDDKFERKNQAGERRGDATADAAVAWLSAVEEPFFGWVHFFDPHDPDIIPPEELCQPFAPPPGSDVYTSTRALYDAEVFFMDMQVQRLLDAVEQRGLAERTIVAVVADHGEGLGDHDWWVHGIIYQEQVRVPMILRKPGGPSGLRVGALVRTIDLMPTLLAWAGIDERLRPEVDGKDLTPLLTQPEAAFAEYAYCDSTNMQTYRRFAKTTQKTDKYYCVMDERWKLIYHQIRPAESELYDLRNDPKESANLYEIEAEVRDRLMAELVRRDPMIDEISGVESLTPELMRKLRSLGYNE